MSAAFSPIQASSFVFPSQNKVVASIRNCSSLMGPEQPDAAERSIYMGRHSLRACIDGSS